MARNFLLGHGERLVKPLKHSGGGGEKRHPYRFSEAQQRLLPKVQMAVEEIENLPEAACPDDCSVVALTMHPAYLAKSYYPTSLLRAVDLQPLGSRPRIVMPEKVIKNKEAVENKTATVTEETVELFVAGKRSNLRLLSESLCDWTEDVNGADDIKKIEDFRSFTLVENRVRTKSEERELFLEVVLHTTAQEEMSYVVNGFDNFIRELGIDNSGLARRIFAGGLCFIPLKMRRELLDDFSKFSFLRVARDMPSLRTFCPTMRVATTRKAFPALLPKTGALDNSIRVAVFDGGLPARNPLERWAKRKKHPDVGKAVSGCTEHGLAVTSALLFGSLKPGSPAPLPFANVEHYRLLDDATGSENPQDLFDVLDRIEDVLTQKKYDFINLSIGPELPVEDDEVHAWTAVLDEHLADGNTLASVAVGNGGELDRASGNARVQVPSDCVNALAVGASDREDSNWRVTKYSSVGPGRAPGVVKPDCLAFGGSNDVPFWVPSANEKPLCTPMQGTSFAAPLALRTAIGLRATIGPVLSPLAAKALLIHKCDPGNNPDFTSAGWGKIAGTVEDYLLCEDDESRVLFQGELRSGGYLRIPIPVPEEQMTGDVSITGTFCFATKIDPQDPFLYTRSGLEVVFRPNSQKYDKGAKRPKSAEFFNAKNLYLTEQELRKEAHKWETTLHASKNKRSTSLYDPIFDIHYNAREAGANPKTTERIPYALVITVKAPKVTDLYNKIVRRYRGKLEALQPVLEVPTRIQT